MRLSSATFHCLTLGDKYQIRFTMNDLLILLSCNTSKFGTKPFCILESLYGIFSNLFLHKKSMNDVLNKPKKKKCLKKIEKIFKNSYASKYCRVASLFCQIFSNIKMLFLRSYLLPLFIFKM